MRKLIFVVICFLLTVSSQAQHFTDFNNYLNNKLISIVAKDYHRGNFKAKDDERTFSIIDSINTPNDLTRPFYLYLSLKIASSSDGALSEYLGSSFKLFTEEKPNELADFFASVKKERSYFFDKWTLLMAGEFQISCDGEEITCINQSMKNTLKKTRREHQNLVREIYINITKHIK